MRELTAELATKRVLPRSGVAYKRKRPRIQNAGVPLVNKEANLRLAHREAVRSAQSDDKSTAEN